MPMIRSRTITMIAALLGALGLTVLSAVPVQAQAVTQSNLEGRLDKIRQAQRNTRIAVDVMVAKWLLTPPDFPTGGPIDASGKWKNTKDKLFDAPKRGGPGPVQRGGFLPASLGVARTDEFDTPLGYCARGKGGVPAVGTSIVYAVIWPGLDGEFQTLCADVLQPPGHTRTVGVRESGANGDDYVAFASVNYILGNAVTKVLDVPDTATLLDPDLTPTDEIAIGEVRFVESTNRIWRWNGTLWEDASGFADTDGDGLPDTLTLTRLTTNELRLVGMNGPLRATGGEVGTFAVTPDATDTLVVTNGDGAAPGNISVGLKPVPQSSLPVVNGTVIPVPIIDEFGRVTGFDNTTDLQAAVGSFSWALAGNSGTTSGGNLGESPTVTSNYIGTNDETDLRLATNGKVRAILGAAGALTVGPLNVTGELISTGNATIGSFTGGSLSIQGPSGQAAPLFRVQNFVGETLTDQVLIASDGTVAMKALGGEAATTLDGIDRVVVSADTGLLSQVSTAALVGATAWALGGNTGTNPATNFVGTVDGQDLAIRTANLERMRILGSGTNAGYVGINTLAPTARLDVDGTLRARGAATFDNTVTVTNLLTANSGVATPSVTNAGTLALNATGATGTLTASTNGSERLRITSAGLVGIGTLAPTARLDVDGTLRARGATTLDSTLSVFGATTLNSTLAVTNAATFGNAVTIAGLLRANGGTDTTILTTSGNATIGGNLTVNGTSQLTGLVTASSGVNTTALAATTSVTTPLLTNVGTLALSATGAAGTITASTNGTERLRITSAGRVGLNTGATVDAALQVNTGADTNIGLIVRGNSATQSADLLRLVRGNGINVLTANANGSITLLPFGGSAGNTNEFRFAGLSGTTYVGFKAPDAIGANLVWTLPAADGGAGNVLATNGGGLLQWINPLTASSGWTLIGNNATTSGGVLGAVPTAGTNFLGTIDEATPVDLRFVTGNRVRAILTAGGQFQTNNVAIGGGTINDTAIGNLSPSTGVFTFLTATNRVTTPLVTGSALQIAASAGTLTLQASGGPIVARTEGVERLRITTGGSVGINQANPTTMLDVNGTFNAELAATFGNTVTVSGTATATKFIATGGTAAGNGMFLPGADTLAFSTANTERLRIDQNGRVGIGMIPVRTLDLTGSFGVTGTADVGGALTVGGATALGNTLTVAGASAINNTLGVTGLLTASGGINTTNLVASGTGSFGGTLGVTGATTLGDTLTVAGASTLNNTLSVTGATTLANALTVGGVSQINNTLGVTGLLTAAGGISTTDLNASGSGSFGGNLGVTGSATVTSLGGAANTNLTGLDRVVMSDSAGLLSQVSTATLVGATAWAITGNTGTNPTNNFVGTRDAADLAIRTNNADRIRILGTGANAGFVGINTTAPTAMLDVNGGLRVRVDSALNGALVVGGATTLNGSLAVGGASFFTGLVAANGGVNTTALTASGNGVFGGTLNVTGASTLGTLSAGNTSISGTLGVNGATTLNSSLAVSGATTVSTLTASGNVTLNGGTANGVAFLNGSRVLTTGGALTFDGTNLAVTGAGTATAAKFIPTGGTAAGNGMYLPAANEVAFSTNGAERLRLDNNGNVGIGTNDPSNLLDVGGTFRATGAANFGSSLTVAVGNFTSLGGTLGVTGVTTLSNLGGTATTTIPAGLDRIVMANNTGVLSQISTSALVTANAWSLSGNPITSSAATLDGAPTGSYLGTTSDQNLQLVTNGVVRAVITNVGQFRTNNVAIGGGTINNTSIGASTASTGRFTTLEATANATVAGTLGVTGLTTATGGVRTPTVNGTTSLGLTADAGTLSLAAGGANIITASTNGAERLRILSGGNVGINNNNPTNVLDVAGTFRATGAATLSNTLGVSGATTLSSTLGVSGATTLSSTLGVSGATTLGSTLTVAGASQVNNTLRATGLLTADSGVRTPSVNSNTDLNLGALNSDSIIFSTDGTERMRVDASGRIGIGTSTPTSAQVMIQNRSPTMPGLMVRGNLLQTGRIIDIQSGSGTTYFSVAADGETRVARPFVTEDETSFVSISGGAPATLMGDNDRIVVANPLGRVAQVSPGAFVDQYAWGLVGNTLPLSGGDLGDFPTGSFLGTTNARDLRLVTHNTVRAILNTADGRFDVASLRAAELSSAANLILRGGATVEGLRVTTTGRVGVGANVTPDAQLQVNAGLGTTRGLVVNGVSGQTANLFEARVNNVTRFSINPAGLVSAAALQVADVGAGDPNTLTPLGYDRVVVANSDGRLSQIAFSQLSNEATWLLAGNTGITSSGNLGQIAGGRFFGMRDVQPIRFVTGDRVQAILTAAGQFQTNNIAIGGGTINGTTIGNSTPAAGTFTSLAANTVSANTSVTTPVVQSGGALSVTAADGGLALAAGGTTNDISFSTGGTQRLLLTSEGRLGLGTNSPGAQFQVNNTSAGTKLLVVNGVVGQTANLIEAQVGGSSRFTVTQAGSVTAAGGVTADSLRVIGVGSGVPNNSTPAGYDRVVIANSAGNFSQIAFSQLTNENTWLIAGNIGGTSGGALGSAPTAGSRILGTRDEVDLRLTTNNLVRAILTADGQFQTNNVAIGGGTIDGVTIGGTTRAPGAFTTVTSSTTVAAGSSITAGTTITAGTSVITPLVTRTGNLAVTANNGALTLSTAGAVSPGSVTVAAGGDNPISLFTDNVERLRITGALGRVGIGTTTPGAQLQVNTPVDSGVGLIVSGTAGATGDLMVVRSGINDVLRVRRTEMIVNNPLIVNGATTVASLNVTGATTLTALGGAAGGLSGDRVVVANASGQLSQVARSTLVTAEAWGLSGNAGIGAGNFIGTTDENDLRFRTNNATRVTITAGGQFQTNNVAIGGGAINNTTIGSGGAAGGSFTTVNASTVNASSVNTPLVTRVNDGLTLSTTATAGNTAGAITLAVGSESPIVFRTTDLGTERMRLTTDGRLGLGTTTPDRTLDILGTFRASSDGSVGGTFGVGGRLTVAGANSTTVNGLTVNGTSLSKIGSLGGDRNEVVLSGFDRVVLANADGELQQFDLSKFELVGGGGGGGGGGGSSVAVDDEGNQLTLSLARLNFVGEGVIATGSGNNVTVTIPGVNGTLTRDPEFDTVRVEDWIRTPRINASGALTVATGGSARLTVTATGQVGIGTVSPAAQLQVVPVDDDTVGLRITGAATSPAANLLEIGTTGSPTNFRVERTGNLVTAGAVNAGGTITFGALGGAASGGLGGNDRIVLANGSGRLAQVSPSALIATVGWSLFGNTLTDETSGGFGEVPVGRYLGTNDAIDLRLVTGGRVRAILTADGVFRSNNAVLTGGSLDGMPIGATTRSTGAFTGVAVTNTLTAGTSVVTPLIANSGNIALTATNGAISLSTIGTDPQGITFSAGGNNTIAFRTDDRERLRIVGGQLSPIVIGGAAAIENSMLQINTTQDSTAGLLVVGTAPSTGDLLRVGIANALDPSDPTPVLRARRTGVSIATLVPGTTALAVNGSTVLTGALTVSESATFNTLAGTANSSLGSNDRVVLSNDSGVISQVTPEGLVADYAWALTGNPITASGGGLGDPATGKYLGTTSDKDLRMVTNGLVRAIVTRGGQFQSDNVALGGGSINATSIGASSRASGAFTTLAANSVVNAPGMTGSSLGFTASNGDIGLTANSGRIALTARGAASPLLFSTRPLDDDVERMRITPDGLIGIGTGIPTAQLQVETAGDDVVGLAVNGTASTSGSALLSVNRGGTSLLSIGRTASTVGTTLTVSGTTSVPALNASGTVTFGTLGGAVNNSLWGDRVVVANSSGQLYQIARGALVTASAWGLSGNANTTADDFLGTTDEADLRFGTNGAIRATLTSGGEFQIADVAIASGTIESTTIGLNAPAAAQFTTAVAGTSVTTPLLRNAGALALTTSAGNLSLNAGGLSRITAATNGSERLRIDEDGRVFIGDRDLNGPALIDPANESLPQLQVNSAAAVSPALVARGFPGQVANLLEIQGYDLASSAFQRELTVNAAGSVNLRSLSGPTNQVVTVGDRLVVSNAQGRLMQVDTVKLITATTWGLTGNAVITQPGTLGTAPTGNFLGTTDSRDVGFVTNNLIRAMIDSGGTFRTARNLVANGVTVGRGKDAMAGNTAVGTNALADNNGGDENSAFGTDALRLNTLGNRNTALGVRAMQGNFVGLNNTAIGVDALRENFDGSGNVALGFEAAYSETGSNRLYIANSRNNNLIYGDFSTGRVLVNAGSTPPVTLGAALQVNTVNAGDVGFIVRGAGGQTANLFEARNSGGGVVARISNAGNTQLSGTLGVSGATTLSSSLDVSGATALGNTLTVANATTLNGATQINNTLTVTGATSLGSNLTVAGNGTITGALDVTGTTRLRNTVQVDGATTISNTLNVTGNTTLGGTLGVTSTATASKFVPTGNVTAGNGMYLPTADEVAFSTAGVERLRLDNNGNVGVGTNDPQFRLDVNGNFRAVGPATLSDTLAVAGATTLSSTLAVTSTATASKLIPTGGTAAGNGMYLPAANTLGFSAGGTERMLVTATGVGIGMTPARVLDVAGTFGATGAATFGGATQVNNTLGVSGATTLSSTLGVAGVTTLSNLGASLNSSMGGNDRIVVTNNTGVLNNVSVAGLVTANAWGLGGNAIGASGDGNSNLNGAPVGNYLGSTSSQPLQFVAGNVVRAIIDDSGEFRIQNIDVRTGTINNASIGATTASTGRFTTLAATGNATVAGTLGVTGATTLGNALSVAGASTLTGLLTANGGVTTTNLNASGTGTFGGLLTANNGVSTTTLITSGDATVGGVLRATGGLENTAIGATTASTGRFTTLAATGNATVAGTLGVTGATTLGNALSVAGASTLTGLLTANGGVTTTNLNASGTGTFGGLLTASNGVSTTTLITSGDTTVGGVLRATGGIENTAIGATTASTGRFTTLAATGNATVAGTLGVTGATTLGNALSVAGASTLTGLVTANGGVTTTNLNASGTGTFGGLLTANNGVSTTTLITSSDATVGGVLRATGGIENTAIGAITANTGRFTSLVATSTTTLTGLLTANGGVGTTTITTSGAGIIGGALRVDGATQLVGALTVDGMVTLANQLDANGGIRTPTLQVTGGNTVGGLLEANGGITTTTLAASGTVTLQPVALAAITPALQFTDLAGDNFVGFRAPNTLTANRVWTLPGADGDSGNVLSTDGGGNLVWVNPVTAGAAWTLTGNGATSSGGALGSAPSPGTNFIGATNNVDLRLVTNNRVRAIVTAGGQFQTNDVAIGGGTITNATINSTSIGATTASTGRFTTLEATGDATVAGVSTLTGLLTANGGVNTTDLNASGTGTFGGLLTASNGVSTTTLTTSGNGTVGGTLTVTGVTLLNSAVTANDGLKVVDGLVTDTLTATSAAISGGTLTGMTISGGSFSGGTIDNAIIGGTTPVAGTFTALTGTQLAANTSLSTPLVTASDALRLAALTSSVIISTGGAEQLRVDGLGNVGIGTDTPQRRLDVVGSFRASDASELGGTLTVTGVTTLTGALNANGGITTGALTATSISTNSISTGTFNASGLVDLDGSFRARGASTFDGTVTLAGGTVNGIPYLNASKVLTTGSALTFDGTNLATTGTASALKFIPTGGTAIGNGMYLPAADTLAFSTNGVERLRIGNDGRVAITNGANIGNQLQINAAASAIGLVVRGAAGQTANLLELQNDAGTALLQVTRDGDMGLGKAPGAGFKLDVEGDIRGTRVFAQGVELTSDARFKTNLQAITDALSIVRKLQGVSYDWNRAAFPDRGFSPRPQIGVIAQEVEKVLPELVSTDAQGFKSVNYTGFIPVLIEGLKQQDTRLDEQDARLVVAEQTLAMVEERLFQAEAQIIQIDERLGKTETFVARFELTREPDTMVVLTPTFKVQNLTADRAYIEELRAARIEADKARFKELDADDAVIDNVDAARLRGRVVNTGGKELFVSYGAVAPLFDAAAGGHYLVTVSADDGSYATAQVISAGGTLRVVPTASQGIDVVANGNSVGLVAPSKKVKASWTRTG
jgi:hypothetical protein